MPFLETLNLSGTSQSPTCICMSSVFHIPSNFPMLMQPHTLPPEKVRADAERNAPCSHEYAGTYSAAFIEHLLYGSHCSTGWGSSSDRETSFFLVVLIVLVQEHWTLCPHSKQFTLG